MASFAFSFLQVAIYANAAGYIYNPMPYNNRGRAAAERTGRGLRYLSECEAMQTVLQAVSNVVSMLPDSSQPAKKNGTDKEVEQDAVPGAGGQSEGTQNQEIPSYQARVEDVESESEAGETVGLSEASVESPASWDAAWPDVEYHEPANLYGATKPYELAVPGRSELDTILNDITQRRARRHKEVQYRIQRYRNGGISPRQDKSEKNKGKKTVRFTLDTKPGSIPSKPPREEKLLSPLPPDDTALTQLSASLATGDGSLFAQPDDFDEAALIRRLPAQMKNGACGLAWCKGRTERGLYLLETPVRRLLLDLRAGVCYDGVSGRVVDVKDVMVCVLWGRGKVAETWGGFGWKRGLEGGK